MEYSPAFLRRGGEESAITKEKKNQTLFSSKSMYFALILLGI